MDQRIKKLIQDGDKHFSNRASLETLWQEMALQFYPELATFTNLRSEGEEFADHLSSSYPLIARRTLGDAFSALLRPVNIDSTSPGVWFRQTVDREEDLDKAGKAWLEWATNIQRRAMYDRVSSFVRATKEGDHSFATFGQVPITVELSRAGDTLLYRTWHLRDVAWLENSEGFIDTVYRKWKPTATQLIDTFREEVDAKVKELLTESPYTEINCRHIVIRADKYEERDKVGKKWGTPWVSIWIDIDNDHVMEEMGKQTRGYVIPRWVTVPGSQYATSPAVTAALPDARLIQAMTLTLLDASEKFADPPIVATEEAIRSDIQLFAGGHTWVDMEYDEKLGSAIRPLYHPSAGQGVGLGLEMTRDVQEMISKAFFLDSLSLPPASTKEMTAFEVGERISEWIRRAMPIFEPMEFEYNGALCDETFELMMLNGAFGSVLDMPDSLKGKDLRFKFESPLHQGAERRKGQKFLEAQAALLTAAEVDPSVIPMLNMQEALRDVYSSIGVPAEWTREEDVMAQINAKREQDEEEAQALAGAGDAASAARDLGSAAKDFGQIPAA